MHDRKVYPPRVEMTVQLMSHEQRHTKLSINFNGCSSERDSPKFQLFLPLGTTKQNNNYHPINHSLCIHCITGHNSEAATAVVLSSTIRKNGIRYNCIYISCCT